MRRQSPPARLARYYGDMNTTPADTPSEGGSGGNGAIHTARDSRLVEKAIRQRWPIDEAKRATIAEALVKIASNRGSSVRNRTVAARVLVAMDAQNLEQEKMDRGQPPPAPALHVHMTYEELLRLPYDELLRLHREALALPLVDSDTPSGQP